MIQVCCKLVNSLDFSPPVSGLINISVQPATTILENLGTIRISAFTFNAATLGPYLGLPCGSFSLEANINWLAKKKCGVWSPSTGITVPGGDNSIVFIPQITSPVTIRTPQDIVVVEGGDNNFISAGPVTLDGIDSLNVSGPLNSLDANASSGPQASVNLSNTYFYKRVKFVGLHEIFHFNTANKLDTGAIDDPVVISIEGVDYTAYPQSISLTIEPPSPAVVTITYVFEDTGVKALDLTSCEV